MTTKSNEYTDIYYLVESCSLVSKLFDYDYEKAAMWMDEGNPMLCGQSPIQMIYDGRGKKLLDFIKIKLEENQLPKELEHDN